MRNRVVVIAAAALSGALLAGTALGQAYPAKPIRILTSTPGTSLDVVLRLIEGGITSSLGQPLVIENRPSSTLPVDVVAKAAPDGYVLGFIANNVWLAPFTRINPPYDPIRDLAPISIVGAVPNMLAISAQLPVNSVAELVAYAKARPDELNVYTAGGGSPTLSTLLFQTATGTKFTSVRYKGVPQGLNDLAAGRIHLMFPTVATALPMAKAGKIKALAVTSKERTPLAPDIPTVAAAGYPGFESLSAQALFGPAKMPAAIVNRLNKEVVGYLATPEARAKIGAMGIDIVASSPAEMAAFVKAEMDRMGPAFKAAGVKPGDWAE